MVMGGLGSEDGQGLTDPGAGGRGAVLANDGHGEVDLGAVVIGELVEPAADSIDQSLDLGDLLARASPRPQPRRNQPTGQGGSHLALADRAASVNAQSSPWRTFDVVGGLRSARSTRLCSGRAARRPSGCGWRCCRASHRQAPVPRVRQRRAAALPHAPVVGQSDGVRPRHRRRRAPGQPCLADHGQAVDRGAGHVHAPTTITARDKLAVSVCPRGRDVVSAVARPSSEMAVAKEGPSTCANRDSRPRRRADRRTATEHDGQPVARLVPRDSPNMPADECRSPPEIAATFDEWTRRSSCKRWLRTQKTGRSGRFCLER